MDIRAEVWSPLQNTAVWLGAWLYGHAATDDFLDALRALGGEQTVADGRPFVDLLALVREEATAAATATTAADGDSPGEPVVRLILSGPGEAPALPAGSESAKRAARNRSGAIVVRTADPDRHLVLIPDAGPRPDAHRSTGDSGRDAAVGTQWEVIEETTPLPAPAWLSPGEADALLTEATNESADMIEAAAAQAEFAAPDLPRPRLTVGTLSDFYDTPGLPAAVPARAAKLFARADNVAAIIESVAERARDHSFDPQLLRLWRHIRAARMTGVAYSVREFSR